MNFSNVDPSAAAGYAAQASGYYDRSPKGQNMLVDPKLAQVTIHEGENIINALIAAAAELAAAIETETVVRRMLKEAEVDMSSAESEIIAEATVEAQAKEGPLAGIAVTSKAYSHALEVLLSKHRNNGHELGAIWQQVQRLRNDADNASIAREQAAVKFSATKHAADLKAAIIRAMAL